MDYITLGSTPPNEDCAQVGSDNYRERAMKECRAYKNQIERLLPPPDGAYLSIKSFPHDFGTYHELVVWCNEEDEEASNYAYKLEGEGPANWDNIAREELGICT